MSGPSVKLYRLRAIFIAYFVMKTLAGTVVAWSVLRPLAGEHAGSMEWPVSSLTIFSLLVAAVILVFAMLVFGQLLLRRSWARMLLLIIGWLTVISAVFSLLASSQITNLSAWIAHWAPGMDLDWEKLMQFDRVQKIFELLFWSYLISVLQIDRELRSEFVPRKTEGDAPRKEEQS